MRAEDQKELLRLADLDYARTADFIAGLMQRQAGMRGLVVTIWAGLLGIAFDRSIWELGALTVVAVFVFLCLDGYYTLLYVQARRHANDLESVSALYYKALIRPDDEYVQEDFLVQLEAYRFGLYKSLRVFRVRDLRDIRRRVEIWFFYPFLVVGAILATILIVFRQAK